ncbi:hypothetical protein [Bacillus wiedmannii]|uniref:beta barrel domain-containing protein n=1 Tax=Bacillus wiedmannii TaxID=1890302 RepID=UPI003D1D9ED5
MATKKDFTIGQRVVFKLGNRDSKLTEGEVTKVGRIYVTVDERMQFEMESMREKVEFGASGMLYLSKQHYLDELELENNIKNIRLKFGHYGRVEVSLEQSRRILEILGE